MAWVSRRALVPLLRAVLRAATGAFLTYFPGSVGSGGPCVPPLPSPLASWSIGRLERLPGPVPTGTPLTFKLYLHPLPSSPGISCPHCSLPAAPSSGFGLSDQRGKFFHPLNQNLFRVSIQLCSLSQAHNEQSSEQNRRKILPSWHLHPNSSNQLLK